MVDVFAGPGDTARVRPRPLLRLDEAEPRGCLRRGVVVGLVAAQPPQHHPQGVGEHRPAVGQLTDVGMSSRSINKQLFMDATRRNQTFIENITL
eukprot:scaffold349426_cov36-Prasinocladus_malaysianus.AAC.1